MAFVVMVAGGGDRAGLTTDKQPAGLDAVEVRGPGSDPPIQAIGLCARRLPPPAKKGA